jgi:hypothetical protein
VTKGDANPKNPVHRLRRAPRCSAKAKSTGERCRCPAVRGWAVCRVHGARGGHAAGPAHPQWKHGGRSQEVVQARAITRLLSNLYSFDGPQEE